VTVSEWVVRLGGEDEDLTALLSIRETASWSIREYNGEILLRSGRLQGVDAPEAGRIGDDLVRQVNATGRLAFGHFRPVSIKGLAQLQPDGTLGHQVVRMTGALARFPLQKYPDPALADADAIANLSEEVAAAAKDRAVDDLLRFLASNDLTYQNLSKVLHKIESDVGGVIYELGWASRRSVTRFDRTALDPRLIGDAARKGHARGDPISNPMPLGEARELVMTIARRYIAYKSEPQGSE
jgi:hypothetical protein